MRHLTAGQKVALLEMRVARLEREARTTDDVVNWLSKKTPNWVKEINALVPVTSRLVGAGKEWVDLLLRSVQDVKSTLDIEVRRNSPKIIQSLEDNFRSVMENAFQTYVSTSSPPKLVRFEPRELLKSEYEHRGNKLSLEELLKHDAIAGQGAYTTYNQWVEDYGPLLNHVVRGNRCDAKDKERLLKKGAKFLSKKSRLLYRFFNLFLKITSQTGLVTSVFASSMVLTTVLGVKVVFNVLQKVLSKVIGEEVKEAEKNPDPNHFVLKTARDQRMVIAHAVQKMEMVYQVLEYEKALG
jgi:hypothetical protein